MTGSTNSIGDYYNGETYQRNDINENLDFDASVCSDSAVTLVYIGANSGEEYINIENNIGHRNNLDTWE